MDHLPECIDLEFDDETGILYWTDRGEIPLGNTLNKKTLIGKPPASEQKLGRQILAQGFAEAIGSYCPSRPLFDGLHTDSVVPQA